MAKVEGIMEELNLQPEEATAYEATTALLNQSTKFLAPIPTVVGLRDLSAEPVDVVSFGNDEPPLQSLLTPNKGHHTLFRALEQLEGLEKEESALLEKSPLTAPLTGVVTCRPCSNSEEALGELATFGSIPRRVCQHPFKRNDIVWVCRTCQADETCVLCHACFSQSNHEGHDVAFYHAQAGGCCDCGDPDAWDPAGFCPHHGPRNTTHSLPESVVQRVRGVVPANVDWMVQRIAQNAEAGHQRAMVFRKDGTLRKSAALPMTAAPRFYPSFRTNFALREPDSQLELEAASMAAASADISIATSTSVSSAQGMSGTLTLAKQDVFSPLAASTSVKASGPYGKMAANPDNPNKQTNLNTNERPASYVEQLGHLGRQGGGLFLVLHADEIHTPSQWVDALRDFLGNSSYYTDSLLAKFVRALRQYGQLVVWGTCELVTECGAAQASLWMDGDRVACEKIGSTMFSRANKLVKNGFWCSIVTREELQLEQQAVAVLQWMSALARSCDPLCQTVATCILPNRHLVPLLRADFKLSARITKAWYSLLLTLLAVPTFKSHLAAAYCDTYRIVTSKYARGMGVLERSAYTLSVQFLNRVTYVVDLVQGRDLLGKLGKSLLETLSVARSPNLSGRLNPNHFVLSHRRYSPCISDLKCVLNVQGMKRLFASQQGTFLFDWVAALSMAQFMDAQVWRHWTQGHVEDELRGWVGAFNLSISLGSLFERLLSWEDNEPSPIKDPSSPLSSNLMTCVELTHHILVTGVTHWQRSESIFCEPTLYTSAIDPHRRCPASLPFSTIAARKGCALAMRQLPVSQVTPFSFHLPLHRFVAACLREVCLREVGGMSDLLQVLQMQLTEQARDDLFRGLMEFPVLVLSRAAQIRTGLWRRNGPGLNDQVLNYAEPPFCRSMRDADLLLVQFAVLKRTLHQSPASRPASDVGISFFVHLLLHRLGVFDFAGLMKAPNSNIQKYEEELSKRMYPRELREDGDHISSGASNLILPWTYAPSKESAPCLLLLEEFLHMMVIFAKELPPVPPKSKQDHTNQAKSRLRREVIHRLASGPKTHSELSEVHLVLSHWDNVFLSEEGKEVNPDDATGAALGAVLAEVADRKSSRGKLEPDKWVLRREAWEEYDPAFFHISLRSHQTAAEGRPQPTKNSNNLFGTSKAFCPGISPAHSVFERLRRDVTADATVLAVVYRILHVHLRANKGKDMSELRGSKLAYDNDERSETALARAVHLLTLGAFAWETAIFEDESWRSNGGGSTGGVFFDRAKTPRANEWIMAAFMTEPKDLLDCEWYEGEETTLLLLQRLAVDGGVVGSFVAQDPAVRSGAAWLCEFAVKHCPAAAALIGEQSKATNKEASEKSGKAESEVQRRKRMAQERARAKMQENAAKFASMMEVELANSGGEEAEKMDQEEVEGGGGGREIYRFSSFGSHRSSSSMDTSAAESEHSGVSGIPATPDSVLDTNFGESAIPNRLLKIRPQCIICSDDGSSDSRPASQRFYDDEGNRRSRRRKIDGGNALGFIGYVQASTVLKGGGGPPTSDSSGMSSVRRFVGTHVALCGHAIHSECCESYLASVSHREDRVIGKRDEFRCPLCQRLSNCLVPFIDVGADWINAPRCLPVETGNAKSEEEDMMEDVVKSPASCVSLSGFLESTPWWIDRHNPNVFWDGHSAFVGKAASTESPERADRNFPNTTVTPDVSSGTSLKPRRRSVRSLRKKDLYAAWNAMMRTPRFVRRRFRPCGGDQPARAARVNEIVSNYPSDTEESSGETVVWRRFMDQVCDIAYRADSKRLEDENLHNDFGEFRHYVVEKASYNFVRKASGNDPSDWPSCVFTSPLSPEQRQELSREKLLSKLLMSIQAFTYTCCCEASEARRFFRKSTTSSLEVAGIFPDTGNLKAALSRFGISGVICDGKLVLMPKPSLHEDEGGQPFNGRIGRLRYLGLAIMAAAGAVAADLVQLVMPFPCEHSSDSKADKSAMDVEKTDRAPIAYPILTGHVLSHVVAAMAASCGRARARSDSLEVVWPVPFSRRGSFESKDGKGSGRVDPVFEDCEGFMKLGLLARVLQVLLNGLNAPPTGIQNPADFVAAIREFRNHTSDDLSEMEQSWMRSCVGILECALAKQSSELTSTHGSSVPSNFYVMFQEACVVAAGAACSFLASAGTILQVLVPGIMTRYDVNDDMLGNEFEKCMSLRTFEKLRTLFKIEQISKMMESHLVRKVVANWYDTACSHGKAGTTANDGSASHGAVAEMRSRLFRTQGFRGFDWPMESSTEYASTQVVPASKESVGKRKIVFQASVVEPQDESSSMQIETIQSPDNETPAAELLRQEAPPNLVTFRSKKTVPLLGGFCVEVPSVKPNFRPRVSVIPTSYTDLYAELGVLLPDCEQTAVCLVCGEVLNAGGKGECTKHSYKCGAGTGMFFLLQECAGLIMHRGKAAYIHSPYVDSHGETPQYRGRPLNLDLARYDHLREVWSGHWVRQHVLAERASSRQVIVPDFY